MKRSSFLKSVLVIIAAPKMLVGANDMYLAERKRRWKECLEYENARQKMGDLVNKKPPSGKLFSFRYRWIYQNNEPSFIKIINL